MTNEEELQGELLKQLEVRGAQTKIANAIGVNGSTVSRWASGDMAIPPAMQKLLRLYLFGEIPFTLLRPTRDAASVLEFTPEEWQLITILASRAGQEPKAWIRSQILAYLAYYKEQATGSDEAPNPLQSLPRAAEDGAPYGPTKKAAG
jgi:transcriptional regulator with XRE-family HTH domain